jgi:hypothetical protein
MAWLTAILDSWCSKSGIKSNILKAVVMQLKIICKNIIIYHAETEAEIFFARFNF